MHHKCQQTETHVILVSTETQMVPLTSKDSILWPNEFWHKHYFKKWLSEITTFKNTEYENMNLYIPTIRGKKP